MKTSFPLSRLVAACLFVVFAPTAAFCAEHTADSPEAFPKDLVLAPDAPSSDPLPREITQRLVQVSLLRQQGKHAEALAELVWCYDQGSKLTQRPELVQAMTGMLWRHLAQEYPPAFVALSDRRNALEQEFIEGNRGVGRAYALAGMNEALNQSDRTWALYQQLPATDLSRRSMATKVFDYLASQQKYKDAAAVKTYDEMLAHFHWSLDNLARPSPVKSERLQEKLARSRHERFINRICLFVEVLAGSGDLEGARSLAAKLIGFDGSSATREAIARAARRAGHPELVTTLPK